MMTVLLAAAFFTLGLYLTMRGGDRLCGRGGAAGGGRAVCRALWSDATLVSLCTTAPELTVSLLATLRGSTELAIGNAVGSAVCNTGLILGVSALLAPAFFAEYEARTKGGLMIGTTILLGLLCSGQPARARGGTWDAGAAVRIPCDEFAGRRQRARPCAARRPDARREAAHSMPVRTGRSGRDVGRQADG